jgi:2-C-methyl-D-erythritol 4-phosphate cytidylyltransferase
MKTTAVILAAGKSERLPGAVPKQFRPVAGMPVLAHTLRRFERCDAVSDVIVVVPEEYVPYTGESIVERFEIKKVRSVIAGGDSRFESVLRGLNALAKDTEIVVTHDAVRPLVSPDLIAETVRICVDENSAVTAVVAGDAVKRVENGYVLATLDRERMYLVQTPQAFKHGLLVESYANASDHYSDDASVVEAAGHKVRIVEGDPMNLKIVRPRDLDLVRFCLSNVDGEANG